MAKSKKMIRTQSMSAILLGIVMTIDLTKIQSFSMILMTHTCTFHLLRMVKTTKISSASRKFPLLQEKRQV